ncbi:MAG TPA: hypothetical protein VHO90_14430 [Bacteroidales bacterium]|nr:hypothetical protein [Bacteroidales bacterium]
MMENNRDIEEAVSGWMKKLSFDEPSKGFSGDVMQSVYALNKSKAKNRFGYWFLVLVPILAACGWYLSLQPAFVAKFKIIWSEVQNYYDTLNSSVGEMVGQLKDISISPIVILIFMAILSLLIIEDIFSTKRHKMMLNHKDSR